MKRFSAVPLFFCIAFLCRFFVPQAAALSRYKNAALYNEPGLLYNEHSIEIADAVLIGVVTVLLALGVLAFLYVKYKRLSNSLERQVKTRTEELERQTATLSAIYRSIPDLVFCKDINGIYTSCNRSFEEFAGMTEAEMIGKTDAEIFKIDAEMARLFREADRRVLKSNSVEIVEELVTYPDGTKKLLETYKTPLLMNGAVIGLLGISRDMTSRKAAETSLERQYEQQKIMAAVSLSFISGSKTDEAITQTLVQACEALGLQRAVLSQFDGKSLHCLYEWCAPGFESSARKGDVITVQENELQIADAMRERRITHFDVSANENKLLIKRYNSGFNQVLLLPVFVGEEFWGIFEFFRLDVKKSWSASDITLGEMLSGIMSGVLNRRVMQKGLERMSAIINSSTQYIAYLNGDGKFDFFSPATCEITGYSHQELMDGGIYMLHDAETNEKIRTELMPAILENGSLNFELPMIRKNGERRILAFSAFTIPSHEYSCGIIASDVTEQKNMERQLVDAKNLAEANSRSKSEFLSRMSHEIRTPLNAIIGMTNIAKSSDSAERVEYCLDRITSASTHLLGVINDVLDMSKIEAGKFDLSYAEFSLEKMIIRASNVVLFRMEEKNQNFTVHIDPDVPYSVKTDEQRLNQVVTNLLSNAVKFTPEHGDISLSVRNLTQEDGFCVIEFEVKDTGIGISEEQQKRLFQSFEQADGGISRKYGGTGLGLAISKRIVEMMGGAIRVESVLNEGSRFLFYIRVEIGSAVRKTSPQDIADWSGLRIIAVDDDPDIRDYFLHFTEKIGVPCEVAASGEEALSIIEETGSYDIIFIDWYMPHMDGIELTRRIKAMYGENAIIIMISATEWSVIEKEAKAAGVDRFIPKPLFASLIIDCVNECLNTSRKTSVTEEPEEEIHDFTGKRLLLAEDVDINREIVLTLLEPTGIAVDCAENGAEAYRMFQENPDYDVVFMDIHMPEVDGFESTRMIRALNNEQAASVPIIAMTANVFREDIEKCFAAGMNDHIGKPLDFNIVLEKLNKYLKRV